MEHNENKIPAPRYALRLAQLREWHVLRVTCGRCRRQGQLYPDHLRRSHAPHTRLIDLEPRLTCVHCGNRDGNHWQVIRIPRD